MADTGTSIAPAPPAAPSVPAVSVKMYSAQDILGLLQLIQGVAIADPSGRPVDLATEATMLRIEQLLITIQNTLVDGLGAGLKL